MAYLGGAEDDHPAGVLTWAWSPIKFQADMGILLMFMFLWNMVGALVLIPALSHFLLSDKHMKTGAYARAGAPTMQREEIHT